MLQNILFSFGIILSAIFLTAIIISAIENEKRAALLFLFIGFLLAIPDCGKCVVSCPYAHPKNLLHNIIRTGIRRNFIFRHLAVKLDDLFYGKKPKSKNPPRWIQESEK